MHVKIRTERIELDCDRLLQSIEWSPTYGGLMPDDDSPFECKHSWSLPLLNRSGWQILGMDPC